MKQHFAELIQQFSGRRIAVIGDLMLDTYLWGSVRRISPEAPVPVLEVARQTRCLGGAGNVMRNIVTLGGRVLVCGVVGQDEAADAMRAEFAAYGINADSLTVDATRRTTVKQRVVAGTQQLLRVDFEDCGAVPERLREEMTGKLCSAIRRGEIDAVIFEDYNKGLLSSPMLAEVIGEARRHHVITALDPKPGNLDPVKGLTLMKPNRSEAMVLSGLGSHATLDEAAVRIRELWDPEQLIVSLAGEGMAVWSGRDYWKIPTRAREVFDVSGAGDTVIATYTLALASGARPDEAAELANRAAGIVVGRLGTATVSSADLKSTLEDTRS